MYTEKDRNIKRKKISLRPETKYWGTFKNENYHFFETLAEFIDNSYSSYIENENEIIKNNPNFILKINIILFIDEYDLSNQKILIQDNAFGMDFVELENAIKLQSNQDKRTKKGLTLNEHGLGFKKAAFWIGSKLKIKTKKFNDLYINSVEEVDINKLKNNIDENYINSNIYNGRKKDSFTIFEIFEPNNNIINKFKWIKNNKIIKKLKDIYKRIILDKKIEIRIVKTKISVYGNKEYLSSVNKDDISSDIYDLEPILINDDEKIQYVFKKEKYEQYKWDFEKDFQIVTDDNKIEFFKIFGNIGITKTWWNFSSNKIFRPGASFFKNKRKICSWAPKDIFPNWSGVLKERVYIEINVSQNFKTISTKNKIKWTGDLKERFLDYIDKFLVRHYKILEICKNLSKNKDDISNNSNNFNIEKFSNNLKKEIKKTKNIDYFKNYKYDIDTSNNKKPLILNKIGKVLKIEINNSLFREINDEKSIKIIIIFIGRILKNLKEKDTNLYKKFIEILLK